jgi:carboxylesterase
MPVTIGLVHGLGGTGATMQPLADLLRARGHRVVAVTLPGHGTEPEHLPGVTWLDWLAAVPDADVLVGQSLGASLALAAAAERPDVHGVVAINPVAPDAEALEGLEWRLARGHEWAEGPPLAEGEAGYDRVPLTALVQMLRGVLATDLSTVTVPVLLVTSAHDDVVDPASADVVAAAIAGPVHRLVLPNSGHVATLGPDLNLLADAIARLL